MMEVGKTYLITTDEWFYAPDGETYKAAFGKLNAILDDQETLGIKTNRGSTNWYVSLGNLLIAGCQIQYVVRTDFCSFQPPLHEIESGGRLLVDRHSMTQIYNAYKGAKSCIDVPDE